MLCLKDRVVKTPTYNWILQRSNSRKGKVESTILSFVSHEITLTYVKDEITDMDLSWASQFVRTKDECIAFVKEEMYSISEIKSIYISIDGESIDIWILIPDRNINLIDRIIEKENKIIDRFIHDGQTKYLFEFHVLYMCQTDESEITPSNSIKIL